jgi:hypothetical protein
MRIYLKTNGLDIHGALFRRTVEKRIPVEFSEEGMVVSFAVNAAIGTAESYRIDLVSGGWQITGSDELGLYFGVGKFLHTAVWKNEEFAPNPPAGIRIPACSFRAMYFPFHHYQWYHMAPLEELADYVEQMLLWGYNTIVCLLPGINVSSFREEGYLDGINRLKLVFQVAKRYGMKVGVISCVNQGIQSAPHELDAEPNTNPLRGNSGRNICIAKPGGLEYLQHCWREGIFEPFANIGLDCFVLWPYDEGGCGCEKCRPWGSNGYLNGCIAFKNEADKYFSEAKYIISTWVFDDPDDEGEYAGLYQRLTGDMAWADYLMVDAHGEFPEYPLKYPVIKPIVNFPEISMWGLSPWGGWGANPLPKRFQRIWDCSKHILNGGMPYSEGIYEDILKIQWSGYYWEPDKHYRDILAEYISYEYAPEVVSQVLEMMEGIEDNHVAVAERREPNLVTALRVAQLAEQVNAGLSEQVKNGWKWRLLYIRAILDEKRYGIYAARDLHGIRDLQLLRSYSGDLLIDDPEAQEVLKELTGWYHMDKANENYATLPQVGGLKRQQVKKTEGQG